MLVTSKDGTTRARTARDEGLSIYGPYEDHDAALAVCEHWEDTDLVDRPDRAGSECVGAVRVSTQAVVQRRRETRWLEATTQWYAGWRCCKQVRHVRLLRRPHLRSPTMPVLRDRERRMVTK